MVYGGFHGHGGTPVHRPFEDGIFSRSQKTIQRFLGVAPSMETAQVLDF